MSSRSPTPTVPGPVCRAGALTGVAGLLWILGGRIPAGGAFLSFPVLFFLLGVTVGLVALAPGGIRPGRKGGFSWTGLLALATLVVVLSFGTTQNDWFFFPRWTLPGMADTSWGDAWVLRLGVLALLAGAVIRWMPDRFWTPAVAAWTVITALACLAALWRETGMAPLYRIDHPSFYYRFQTFLEGFPHPGFYDPHWNAGKPVPYLVASGVWALGIPWLPLLLLVPLEQLFTPMIAVTFLAVVPASGYLASRGFGDSPRAAWITALLFLVPGQRYFTHILNYGTTPSMFCLCLSPLVLACLWRLLHAEGRRALLRWSGALSGVGALVLSWPGALLLGIPLGASALMVWRRLTPRRLLWLGVCAGVLVLLLTPLAVVPLRYSPIGAFFELHEPRSAWGKILAGRYHLGDLVQGVHPVILVAAAIGVWCDPNRERGRFTAAFLAAAVLTAGWGEQFRPLLQWERLIIPASLLGAVVAGRTLERLTRPEAVRLPVNRLFLAWCVALLMLGGYQGVRIWGNRGRMDFQTMPPHTRELVDWLSDHVPEGTRILIAGPAVHGFGGAKVAALPLLIGREMISCDYYGFSPKLVEFQCPPRRVLRRGPDAVLAYLDLHNVSHILTYHAGWKAALERHPDYYEPLGDFGRVSVYRVREPAGPLVGAEGRVRARANRITVELAEPVPDRLILKYNWAEGWRVSEPASVHPASVDFGLTFIGVRPGGAPTLELTFDP